MRTYLKMDLFIRHIPVAHPSGQPAAVHKTVGNGFEHYAKHNGLQGEVQGSTE